MFVEISVANIEQIKREHIKKHLTKTHISFDLLSYNYYIFICSSLIYRPVNIYMFYNMIFTCISL
jgi:hypothetical protein